MVLLPLLVLCLLNPMTGRKPRVGGGWWLRKATLVFLFFRAPQWQEGGRRQGSAPAARETRTRGATEHVLFVSSEKHKFWEDKSSQAFQSDHSINTFMTKKENDSGQFLLEEPKFCPFCLSPFMPGPSCCHGNQRGQMLLVLCLLLFTGLVVLTQNRKSMNTVEWPL